MKINDLDLAKGLEDLTDVRLSQSKVERSDVESVEVHKGSAKGVFPVNGKGDEPVALSGTGLAVACLAVLLRLGVLNNDGDPEKLSIRQSESLGDGVEIDKLDVANTVGIISPSRSGWAGERPDPLDLREMRSTMTRTSRTLPAC